MRHGNALKTTSGALCVSCRRSTLLRWGIKSEIMLLSVVCHYACGRTAFSSVLKSLGWSSVKLAHLAVMGGDVHVGNPACLIANRACR